VFFDWMQHRGRVAVAHCDPAVTMIAGFSSGPEARIPHGYSIVKNLRRMSRQEFLEKNGQPVLADMHNAGRQCRPVSW
jgi:hypothetical protein